MNDDPLGVVEAAQLPVDRDELEQRPVVIRRKLQETFVAFAAAA